MGTIDKLLRISLLLTLAIIKDPSHTLLLYSGKPISDRRKMITCVVACGISLLVPLDICLKVNSTRIWSVL
jgi:hypothetical protein